MKNNLIKGVVISLMILGIIYLSDIAPYLTVLSILALFLMGIFHSREEPMWFTICFVILASTVVYGLSGDYFPVVLTAIGLIIANHTVQPLFYPTIIENEIK